MSFQERHLHRPPPQPHKNNFLGGEYHTLPFQRFAFRQLTQQQSSRMKNKEAWFGDPNITDRNVLQDS